MKVSLPRLTMDCAGTGGSQLRAILLWLAVGCLAACGGKNQAASDLNGPGPDPGQPPPAAVDTEVRALAASLSLTGDPAVSRAAQQTVPSTNAKVKLGQLLFFSQTLSADYDISCGTCHHPDFAFSDGLSISVGVAPKDASIIGPGREVDSARDRDPAADGGPNMHRNSSTTLNAALFDRALMHDGRVFVLDSARASGGRGQAISTPESGLIRDVNPMNGLLEFTVKGPIVNDNEMRGFLYTNYATPVEYREHLTKRLRGEVDSIYNTVPQASQNWLRFFRAGFDQPTATAQQVITSANVQRALAAFIQSQVFVDTPWRQYLNGDTGAISADAKAGARLFLNSRQAGGLGCNACHAGDRFTDEAFHNVGFPQIGRGFGRADRGDLGRWIATRDNEDMHAFRTPTLLNAARTAPYGHAGAFASLADAVAYHANPRAAVDSFNFSLTQLAQFSSGSVSYPNAAGFTSNAMAQPNFPVAEALLPGRQLTAVEINQLVAFIETLTDRCVASPSCIDQWIPQSWEDPDGNTLVRSQSQAPRFGVGAGRQLPAPQHISLTFPAVPTLPTFADVQGCTNNIATSHNTGESGFTRRSDAGFGLNDGSGYSQSVWFGMFTVETAMIGGGVTAGYLDDDCWPDLAFTGNEASGMRFYRNSAGAGFAALDLLEGAPQSGFSGTAIADLNGDYRREMLFGNVWFGSVPIYSANGSGKFGKAAELPTTRPTYGISFAPLDSSGELYFYLTHWSGGSGTNGADPALWRYGGAAVHSWDQAASTTSAFVDQRFNFTPKFADFTGDGRIDLVIASDFGTSVTLRNVPDNAGGLRFTNETDRAVITDQNGMGSALLDIDNDGKLEWFVTSVYDASTPKLGNWGSTGNRLYRNVSSADRIAFSDITAQAGVRDGNWGWGACAADFNNDGFIDLFHVNGFGRIPDAVVTNPEQRILQDNYNSITAALFQNQPSRLFINNGNGTFSNQASLWGIDAASEGRGLSCFDYDRDGDVDIVLFDHSRELQFFENRSGSGAGHRFLGVRVVGPAPNTDAIGTRVSVTADVGQGHGTQTQLRLSEANSNFNSQNLPDMYFGLGGAALVNRINVHWPDGTQLTCLNVAVNQFVVLDQRLGQGACPAPLP
jgi:cytochrome c peroxidase